VRLSKIQDDEITTTRIYYKHDYPCYREPTSYVIDNYNLDAGFST